MAEFILTGFIIIIFTSIGIKYARELCKKPIEQEIDIIVENENDNVLNQENEVPPKYEDINN